MYKATIIPKTSFITNLSSSTIFGAACWAIRDIYGEDKLMEVFEQEDSLVFSNAFISGYLPAGYNKSSNLKNMVTGEEIAGDFQAYRIDHCMVDRDTNTSSKHWIDYEHFETRKLDIYIESSIFNKEELTRIIEVMLLRGIGKSKNRGKGQFKLDRITEVNWDEIGDAEPNGYMVISDYIPNKTDSTIGKYSARVINRKTLNGEVCKPVYVINAGSVFAGSLHGHLVGRLQYDENTGTYLSGRAIAIPLRIQ